MKTRTLLLLALACGLAIMLAGAVFLFQLAGQDDLADPIELGEPVAVGDMVVTILSSNEAAGELVIDARIGGVDDADGANGFHLIASGRPLDPVDVEREGACSTTTVAAQECSVRFDTSGADGSSRVLFYERGDERVRWVIA